MSTSPAHAPPAPPLHRPGGPDAEAIRAQFPALAQPTVFLDNAGGSQVPRVVADRMRDYMLSTYVQLGADYEVSRRSTALVQRAHDFIRTLMNGDGVGEVVLGASTSALCRMLAACYADANDSVRGEVVVCETAHESNFGPWAELARRGWTVKPWKVDPRTGVCSLDDLRRLLGLKTRIVAFPHVSNILGGIVDVRAVAKLTHSVGARVVVDGVAFAPHRAIDVKALGCDWYVYSTYKVYGPHMAALFGTREAFAELNGPNHFFIPRDEVPYKFELGGVSHEGCAGLVALGEYLRFLAGDPATGAGSVDRAVIERAFAVMTAREFPLQERLISYLRTKPRVRLVGPEGSDASRVATVSFVRESKPSREIATAANAKGLGIRYGHFYAHRLCAAMGIDPADGVVRASLVHYNTVEEVDRLIDFLETVL